MAEITTATGFRPFLTHESISVARPMRGQSLEDLGKSRGLVLRVAIDMEGSAYGLALEDIRNYPEEPQTRRTAERPRDAVKRLFRQIEPANPGECRSAGECRPTL